MLSLASLNKMKGQVFQKHACVHPKHEKHSPGVPGFSVHSSSYLRILTCRLVLNAVHAQVTHIAGHLERKVNSIFSGKKKMVQLQNAEGDRGEFSWDRKLVHMPSQLNKFFYEKLIRSSENPLRRSPTVLRDSNISNASSLEFVPKDDTGGEKELLILPWKWEKWVFSFMAE